MYVLPTSFDGRSFELLIVLDDIGLGRIVNYDPAVIRMMDLPRKWQIMALDHYHLAYAADVLLRGDHGSGQPQPACMFAFSISPPAAVKAPATVFSILDDANLAHLRSGKQIIVPFRQAMPPEETQNPRELVIAYATPGDMEVVDYSLDKLDAWTAARQVTRGFAWRRDLGDPMP